MTGLCDTRTRLRTIVTNTLLALEYVGGIDHEGMKRISDVMHKECKRTREEEQKNDK